MAETLPAHIVVINDEQTMLNLFRDILEEEGFRVSTLTYPMTDMGDLVILGPDLLILDLLMGGENRGWQALQELRIDRRTATLPVIVCSAAVHLLREVREHLATMNIGVVLKPFDIEPFLAEVRRQLGDRAQST